MHLRSIIVACGVLTSSTFVLAEEFKLPPEVTPAMRSACESDVRRLCVGENPTLSKVRDCVEQKFSQLNTRCKMAIASAGLSPRRSQADTVADNKTRDTP